MFFNKPKSEPKEEKPDTVKCQTCRHIVEVEDMQRVYIGGPYLSRNEFYCKLCAKPYDIVIYTDYDEKTGTYTPRYKKKIPAHEIEVNYDGIPVKEQKKSKK